MPYKLTSHRGLEAVVRLWACLSSKCDIHADDPTVNLMEIFTSFDADTLRRVFRMGSLTESELRKIGSKQAAVVAD